VIIGRRRGLTASHPVQGPDVQAERNSELTSSLSRLLKSDVQYFSSDPTVEVVDHVLLPNPVNGAPTDYLQHVSNRQPGDRSEECMTRSSLASIMIASNFTTWLSIAKEPFFDFSQFVHPISADHLLTLTCFNLDPRLMHTDIPLPFTSTQFAIKVS
jgi:hypothetical protein